MTPNARYAAAIDILDRIQRGDAAEKVLTNWARSNRFAGSKDRREIRNIVFDALRRKIEAQVLGGGSTGRQIVLGLLRLNDIDPQSVFTGEGYAPPLLSEGELNFLLTDVQPSEDDKCNIQEWMLSKVPANLKDEFRSQSSRADLYLRVNKRKSNLEDALNDLASDAIDCEALDAPPFALRVEKGAQHVARSNAYLSGKVEIQDAGSQAVIHALNIPVEKSASILDYCAGGGGKSLALAALSEATISAWDENTNRMNDLSGRAERAGVAIKILTEQPTEDKTFDYVLLDVPCSGSGAWRRNPDGKWKITENDFENLLVTQKEILRNAVKLTNQSGKIGYVTCSLFEQEDMSQVRAFLADCRDWSLAQSGAFYPSEGTDGFFYAEFERQSL